MRRNIIYVLLGTLVVGLVVGLTFAFNNTALLNDKTVFAFYLTAKILFGIIFVGIIVYGIMCEKARGSYYPMVVTSLITQFIPLLMRAYIGLPVFKLGACLITIIVAAAALVIIVGIMPGISKKQLEADEKFASPEIEVKKNLPDRF